MSRSIGLLALAMLSTSAQVACSSGSSSSTTVNGVFVTDTLGVRFSVSCASAYCALTPVDPSITPTSCELGNGITDAFVLVWEGIIRVHALRVPADGNLQFNPADPGHPIICTVDTDCQITSYPYACIDGLCRRADVAMTTNDVIALCQADIQWPTTCPYITSQPFAGRLVEVAASCGSQITCAAVPGDCRQPTISADGGGQPGIDAGP